MNIVVKPRFGEYAVIFNGLVIALGTLGECQKIVKAMA